MPESRPIASAPDTESIKTRKARLSAAARSVRAVANSLRAAARELGSSGALTSPPEPAFEELREAQKELARVAHLLQSKDAESRAELIRQIEALRSNIGIKVGEIVGTCRQPALGSNELAAAQRRADLFSATRSVERLLTRAMQALADVHRFERRVEVAAKRVGTRP